MSSHQNDEDLLTSHNYDGIQEYDNPMPGWWTFIFVANIVWAAVYLIGINLGLLPEYEDDLREDMAIQAALEERNKKELPPVTPEMLADALKDEAQLASGAEVFAMTCKTCHGARGEGSIGPNLTDDAWINGDGGLDALHTVIAGGTPNGMPPWGAVLPQDQLVSVTAFVKTLQGTDPPNAKPAEGVGAAATPPSDESSDDG